MSDFRPVQFTYESAERIANVVRAAETAPRPGRGLTFDRIDEVARRVRVFRVATFTGAWPIGSTQTVTFKNVTTTPNTASATNLFWPIPDGAQRDCAIAKDGTAWYLLMPQLQAATALSSVTLGNSLAFGRANVVSLGTASTVSISISTCSTSTATP